MKCILRLLSILMAVLLPSVGWTAIVDEPKLSAPSLPPRSPAHTLTQVELKQSGGQATVLISGDGWLSYRVRPLGTDRVIVDLLHVSTKLTHAFEFNDRIVRQIRIGQHPNVLRLVIDLRQAAIYSVEEGTTTLSIVLASRADTKKSSKTAVFSEPSPDVLGSQVEDRVTTSTPRYTDESGRPPGGRSSDDPYDRTLCSCIWRSFAVPVIHECPWCRKQCIRSIKQP
jgi:hypothetical protein